MEKRFNTTGVCIPEKHYMVDISSKMKKVIDMIEYGDYFTINRARQYGKTTMLFCLPSSLPKDYVCINISFEGIDYTAFESPANFCQMFLRQISRDLSLSHESLSAQWLDDSVTTFEMLEVKISKIVTSRKVVLTIDEVDKACDYEVFLHFLGTLRSLFLKKTKFPTFQSVILVSVYDIKNLKAKMMQEGTRGETDNAKTIEKSIGSPWNIAANFKVDMSFNPADISTMLESYESEHNTGMDIVTVANEIHKYTRGYPFMVSRICQLIDDDLDCGWNADGVQEAVKIMSTTETNTLLDELFKNLHNNKEIYDFMYDILIMGNHRPREAYTHEVSWGTMFGFIRRESNGEIRIANKIFEARLMNYFITVETNNKNIRDENCNEFRIEVVRDGILNMEMCLLKFKETYARLYSDVDAPALERYCKPMFLSFVQPIINGNGFINMESQFTDGRRMDVVISYGKQQYVIELKLWRGDTLHKKAYTQLLGYMDKMGEEKGYMLTFDIRQNKQPKAEWVEIEGKRIFDVIV